MIFSFIESRQLYHTNKKRLSDSGKGVSNKIIHTVATSYPREMLSTLAFQAGNLALPVKKTTGHYSCGTAPDFDRLSPL
jgi:hypothetical protein